MAASTGCRLMLSGSDFLLAILYYIRYIYFIYSAVPSGHPTLSVTVYEGITGIEARGWGAAGFIFFQ